MARAGLDLSDHVSRQIDGYMIDDADLVITMERQHLAIVGELSPAAARRAFTLKELARLAPRGAETGLRELGRRRQRRTPERRHVGPVGDDVADPMGRSGRHYRRAAEELDQLVGIVVTSAFSR